MIFPVVPVQKQILAIMPVLRKGAGIFFAHPESFRNSLRLPLKRLEECSILQPALFWLSTLAARHKITP
jgi:hypothetical protein